MPLPTSAQKSRLPVIPKEAPAAQPFPFDRFPHGLNTSKESNLIFPSELSELVNFTILDGGTLESRSPIYPHITNTVTSTPYPVCHVQIPIDGTNRELIVYSNHKLYYNNAGTPTLIGTLEGEPKIHPYKGVALICDGSYLKYLSGITSGDLSMAYDSGTGSTGFQFDNRALTSDTALLLGNGTNTRIATKFTSQGWTAAWTIPPTTIHAKLKKIGSPTGNLLMVLRLVSDSSVLATKTMLEVSTLTGTEEAYYSTYSSSDITTKMSPSVAYYCSLEYAGGDGSNHVSVSCNNIGTGGKGYFYDGSWTAQTATEPLIALRPGAPPKATDCRVKDTRVFLVGSPDKPGGATVSNVNTYSDWSTSDHAGFIGTQDDDNNTFEVGAVENLYGDLYFYGTKALPYLSKLTGDTPADYAIPVTRQRVNSTRKCIVSVVDDIWTASKDGVDNLRGVEQFGDLRTFSNSDPISDRIRDYFDETTDFIEYFPEYGQIFLVMAAYHRICVCHIKNRAPEPGSDMPNRYRYPWAEYELYLAVLTGSDYKWTASGNGTNEYYLEATAGGTPGIAVQPDAITLDGKRITEGTVGSLDDHGWDYGDNDTLGYSTVYFADASGDPDSTGVDIRQLIIPTSLSAFNDIFHVGCSNGKLYKFDDDYYKDHGTIQAKCKYKTATAEFPLREHTIETVQPLGGSEYGSRFELNLYKDGEAVTPVYSSTIMLPLSSSITGDEATMDADDAIFAVDAEGSPSRHPVYTSASAMQWEVKDVYLTGSKVSFNGLLVSHRQQTMK